MSDVLLYEKIKRLNYIAMHSAKNEIQNYLTDDCVEKICKYLKNPTANGLWILKGTWRGNDGITSEIIKELQNNDSSDEKPKDECKKYVLDEEDMDNTRKMTFLFQLFYYMSSSNSEKTKKNKLAALEREYHKIIEMLDLEKIKKKYSKQLDYFKNEIFVKGLAPIIRKDEFICTKSGIMLCEDFSSVAHKTHNQNMIWITLGAEPIEKMISFLESLGKISDYVQYPVYSPEEAVFEPYHIFLNLAKEKLIERGKILTFIDQSISSYEDKNYPYCISTIGLALEEQVTQIYETLFRKKCPQNLTLGALVDLIGKETAKSFPVDKAKNIIDIDGLYRKINELSENTAPENSPDINLLPIIRNILTLVKENKKNILPREISQKSKHVSIFPKEIKQGIEELIMYRNAISHRSRIPIGSFEAIKSIFHILSVIMWWRQEKKVINWKEEPENIIMKMVERSNLSSTD